MRDVAVALTPRRRHGGLVTRGGGSRLGRRRPRVVSRAARPADRARSRRGCRPATGARVTIVPHGPLFGLSFAALLDSARPLFRRALYPVHYAPSAAALQMPAPARGGGAAPAALSGGRGSGGGGRRRDSCRVCRALATKPPRRALLSRGTATVVTGTHAPILRASPALATGQHGAALRHARRRLRRPSARLYLALAGGRLTTRDIYGLDLHADLIFLSACRSGGRADHRRRD